MMSIFVSPWVEERLVLYLVMNSSVQSRLPDNFHQWSLGTHLPKKQQKASIYLAYVASSFQTFSPFFLPFSPGQLHCFPSILLKSANEYYFFIMYIMNIIIGTIRSKQWSRTVDFQALHLFVIMQHTSWFWSSLLYSYYLFGLLFLLQAIFILWTSVLQEQLETFILRTRG